MSNISIIRSISIKSNDSLVSIPFVFQSASLEVRSERNAQGVLYTYSLSFKSTPISDTMDNLLNELRRTSHIQVMDFNGTLIAFGDSYLRHTVEMKKVTSGSAGSFRGYVVDVEFKSIF